jgi:hypothetical protein
LYAWKFLQNDVTIKSTDLFRHFQQTDLTESEIDESLQNKIYSRIARTESVKENMYPDQGDQISL